MNDELCRRLRQLSDHDGDHAGWRPTLFRPGPDGSALAALLDSGAVRRVRDTLTGQLRALLSARHPADRLSAAELEQRVWAFLAGQHPADYGTWIWYPWSATLAHALPEAEYRELRTSRNRHKITQAEQRRLAGTRIGVVGLSVGNAAAVTLALEGIGGAFKIADFDRLELSNLNRIRGRLADLGVEKTVLAARQMFDLDPYLDIEPFADGVRPENVDEFLLGGGKLDLVVEECDDLHLKVLIRERARTHRIPVLMDTSDRGMLDVERFDLEPDRPVFHGLVPSVRAADLRGLTSLDKIPFMLAVLDEQRLSTRAVASLPEVGHTLETWPQLASDVALGGAIIADAARRLLLGEPVPSGRYYLDPATLVTPDTGLHHTPATPVTPPAVGSNGAPPLPPEPGGERSARRPRGGSPQSARWRRPRTTPSPGHSPGGPMPPGWSAGTTRPGTCPAWTSSTAPPGSRSVPWWRTWSWPRLTSACGRRPGSGRAATSRRWSARSPSPPTHNHRRRRYRSATWSQGAPTGGVVRADRSGRGWRRCSRRSARTPVDGCGCWPPNRSWPRSGR